MTSLNIAGRQIGLGHPCFVIAEAGVNHNGSLDLARRLIDAAADAGADAVKFQTFQAEQLVTADAPKAIYQQQTTDADESQFTMLKRLELDAPAHHELMAHTAARGLIFLSTPFDEPSADLLEALDLPAFKIPSGEITNFPLLEHVARKRRPIILSTGMSTLAEVEAAVAAIRGAGDGGLALLHCVSCYPTAPIDANLRAMQTMTAAFPVPVGFSDHTLGTEVALAAVALGAQIIEKHLTLDRSLPGPDHAASLEPAEFKALLRGIRNVETALGHGRKEPALSEANTAAVARKSLIAARDLPAGEVLDATAIAIKRPGTGLAPARRGELVGRKTRIAVPAGTLFTLEMFA
ncbi:MAG: N,N-diacetyllegionaminate synthase [Chthoniobacter sp.]|jgi:N-acetylneuraminate synthase/N,N'-diacetyllegionaminate synthase|nr:N,N-diacetyllegionaminate synthase [Chthoniobacter sp.]